MFHELPDHVTQDHANRVKPFVGRTDIGETDIIKQDLLHDEDRDRFAKFGACFHYSKAERDDFGGKEEIDNIGGIIFDQGTDNTKGSEA